MSGSKAQIGGLARFGIGAQVLLTAALALAALLLVNWLVARPGLRQRLDLTSSGSNTLSTASMGVLDQLESDIQVDILYRPMDAPLTALCQEVLVRTDRLLVMMEEAAAGRIAIQAVDTNDLEAWRIRQQQLRLRGYENGLVISNGERREFLAMSGDLAVFDLGNPVAKLPPRILEFEAERAIVDAILEVTKGAERHVYFTYGYGEPDALESADPFGLGLLSDDLEQDGLVVHRWNYLEDGPLPEDCDAVAVVGPDVAWPEDMYAEVVNYVEAGGRLMVAPAVDAVGLRASVVPDLLEHFGLEVSEGRVAGAFFNGATLVEGGDVRCEWHVVTPEQMSRHPILQAMRAASESFQFNHSHRVQVGVQPQDGVAQNLFMSSPASWLDAPPGDRYYDQSMDGTFRSIPLAATVQRPPMVDLETPKGLEVEPEIRIVALGSQYMLCNDALESPQYRSSDLLRAAFNWLLDREYRIKVTERDPDFRYLPLDRPEGVAWVMNVAQYFLPLGALLAGALVWWRRMRGSRRVTAKTPSPEGDAR